MNRLIKHKLFISIIKWIPVVVAAGILFNNTLASFDVDIMLNVVFDYIFGTSLAFIITLYSASITLEFCKWHRIVIIYDAFVLFINYIINNTTILNYVNFKTITIHYVIAGIFVIILSYNHVKATKTNKNNDKTTS